ncbi:hemin uptake protein HemP [bacterium]|nr:hemin uptake protein HemP [bacterium]
MTMLHSYDVVSGTQGSERSQDRNQSDSCQTSPIKSQHLLQGQRQVWIDHGGTLYCLKATSSGRLYLTK